uniref:Uncharacterized protein n=1 Tax=Palpitomonas bilix TaxID=652834 RepID=A0A7S3DEW2_9EUKA|mmetsp:Transcript_34840/g.90304  ORF Transcript_34840/g.90304 Transcript_34840/m.90304 type:complete len:134 (+) Transcript_34840:38-439(+)
MKREKHSFNGIKVKGEGFARLHDHSHLPMVAWTVVPCTFFPLPRSMAVQLFFSSVECVLTALLCASNYSVCLCAAVLDAALDCFLTKTDTFHHLHLHISILNLQGYTYSILHIDNTHFVLAAGLLASGERAAH